MPSKRVRATWSEESLRAAMVAVEEGHLTQCAAAELHGIPRQTLAGHLRTGNSVKRMGRITLLNEMEENILVNRLMNLSNNGLALTSKIICREAFAYCEENNIRHNFNSGLAGKKWLRGFLKRHPVILNEKIG